MSKISYTPQGVCCRQIEVEVDEGIVKSVRFIGGCNGNTQGVAKLCIGRKAGEVIDILKGTNCNGRGTSCPDQLAKALEQAIK